MVVDRRTPVIVGVGQFTVHIDVGGYRCMSSVELATEGAQAALRDCGVDAGVIARAADAVAGVRQFEISKPTPPPFGASNNYPRSVARRIGAEPARAVLEVIGGQGPQHLVTEFAGPIAAGESDVVLLFGSDAVSTERYFAKRHDKPDFSESVDGQLEDRGFGYDGIFDEYTIAHGLIGASVPPPLPRSAKR